VRVEDRLEAVEDRFEAVEVDVVAMVGYARHTDCSCRIAWARLFARQRATCLQCGCESVVVRVSKLVDSR